jgi:hypothetical protein
MAATKDDAHIDTVSHLETVSDEKHGHSQEEEVLGRDFTVAESELPEGYFTSANFLGSSTFTVHQPTCLSQFTTTDYA